MIGRAISKLLRQRLEKYPAVALVGPRQAGKTTLARSFPGEHFDLEQENERLRLDLAWDRLVQGSKCIILDEAQAWPEVFPRMRGAIDRERGRRGRFLILGSVSPSLMEEVSESLAGRLSVVELTPFLLNELGKVPLDSLWLRGGYPDGGILEPDRFPLWAMDYLTLLTQRDLPNWGFPAKPQMTTRLLRMVAAVHGQLWNASQIGQSLGISYATVNGYLDYLEGAFLIRRLPPYHASIRKRLVKSPKVYWRDSGLLHSLMRVDTHDRLLSQPWVGASWEGFVIEQILGTLSAADRSAEPFFLRTSDGYEIDLILEFGRDLWAIEIKLTSRPSEEDLRKLDKTANLIGGKRRFLISQAREPIIEKNRVSCDLPRFLEILLEESRKR